MPKHASMSQAESREQNDQVELDPIVWGLLEKVPAPGETWPKAQRQAWLNILTQTFDMLYPEEKPAPHAATQHP